jgi:cation:H+ antiporter
LRKSIFAQQIRKCCDMDAVCIIGGLVFLIFGGDWLLKSAVGFSLFLKIPKIVIGMTIVSFATSAPELIVSLKSAMQGHADLAVGNVLGSNIANLGLVLGVTVLLSTIHVEKSFYRTDWPVMMLSAVLLYVFLIFDGVLQSYEGALLFFLLLLFLVYLLKFQKAASPEDIPEEEAAVPLYKNAFYLIMGSFALWGGSELLIFGAVHTASYYGVSERIIGVTVVSIGTSIPELSASLIAILKREKAISLGNLIGSNVFNILAVLGLTSLVSPIKVTDQALLQSDVYWMLAISFAVLPLTFLFDKMKLGKLEGFVLLVSYLFFISQVAIQ